MIDYLVAFASVSERAAAFPAPEPDAGCWTKDDLTIMLVTVLIREPDPENSVDAVYSNSTWLVIRSPERSSEVESMPNCLVATDQTLAMKKLPFVLFCKLPDATQIGSISPVFSGDQYKFTPGAPASSLKAMLVT